MTQTTLTLLDQTELQQLATNASLAGDAGAAIGYLKEAVSRPDSTALAHFLLGSEYAQIKLYDRAADEMEAALALDPALSIARFQLGLLWLSGGLAERAELVFGPLAELPAGDALRHLGAGLCSLIKDDFDVAVASLQAGMALNTSNAPLNADMQMIIERIATQRAEAPVAQQGASGAGEQDGSIADEDRTHVLLSAYTGNTSH